MIRAALLLAALALPAVAHAATPADTAAAPKPPKEREISYFYDQFEHGLVRPFTRIADPSRWVRKATGHPREAVNVDENDQVRLPSTWWQPRVGYRPVSPEQLAHGPGTGAGPAPGPFTVTKAKDQGVTPGFFIEDSAGDKYLVKFDPPGSPELTTGADVVTSVLLWGAGYNVPDDAVFAFHREDVKLGKKVELTESGGRKHPMTQADVDRLLSRVARLPDGRYPAVASRLLKGKPLGPFRYEKRRPDDPEDLIPHEHRRELRGLWPIAAWLGHTDVRSPNSLDMWVKDGGRQFVRHYLIDFNGTLGGGSKGPKAVESGFEYFVDFGVMGRQLVTLGLEKRPWEDLKTSPLPCVGPFESEQFHPEGWRPDYPNPAFDEKTHRDIVWGARIVAGFSDDQIRAAVDRAHFSDPQCAARIAQVLIERRDKIAQHWLGSVSPSGAASR